MKSSLSIFACCECTCVSCFIHVVFSFLIAGLPSSVRLSVLPPVRLLTFHIFMNLLHRKHWDLQLNQTWHKSSLGKGNSNLLKWKDPTCTLFQGGGGDKEIAIIHWQNLKTYSRTIWSFSTKFTFNLIQSTLEWRGFKFVKMKGFVLFQEEIIRKSRKYIDEIWKSFPEPISQFQSNLTQSILG